MTKLQNPTYDSPLEPTSKKHFEGIPILSGELTDWYRKIAKSSTLELNPNWLFGTLNYCSNPDKKMAISSD